MMGVVLGLMLICKTYTYFSISNDTIPSKSHLVLPEINIKGNAMVAKRRGDTLVFSADRYKRADAIRLEQLLSNVPGFQVEANGRISFNGKPIQKLMLDGDDLTSENYQLISRNLRSLLIDSIQVLEKYTENRLLKNLNDNNGIAINLVLKPNYYARPTVNILSAYAPKKYGELQNELIQLHKRMKNFILFNTNSIGASPLQNQFIDYTVEQQNMHGLYRSWPSALEKTLVGTIDYKYFNQNNDWGLGYAGTAKVGQYNQLRLFIRKSNQIITNRILQDQIFAEGDDSIIRLRSVEVQSIYQNQLSGSIDWNSDKGSKTLTKYQFKFYHDITKGHTNEERELIVLNKVLSNSNLNSKGVKFSIEHTWKPKTNHIWVWEADVQGSTNKYFIKVLRNELKTLDSLSIDLSQFLQHNAVNATTAIGYFFSRPKIDLKFKLMTSLSGIHSRSGMQTLGLTNSKTYFSMQLKKGITKKFYFHMQSMVGLVYFRVNNHISVKTIYHVDHGFVWKRKATQQISFNYGVLRKATTPVNFYAGEILLHGTTSLKGPVHPNFPFSVYGQFNFSSFNLYSGLTIGGQATIKKVIGDYLTSVEIDQMYTSVKPILNGRELSKTVNIHIEKMIHPIRLKYRLQTHLVYLKQLTMFNTTLLNGRNQIYRFGNFLSTNWRKGYNIQLEHQHIRSNFNSVNSNFILWNNRNEFKTTVQLKVNPLINLHISLIRYYGKDLYPLNLLDCNINWIIKSKYRFYLKGFNLLDRKLFIQQGLLNNSISTTNQQLLGRRVIFGIDLPI